jgi:ribosomal protein L23
MLIHRPLISDKSKKLYKENKVVVLLVNPKANKFQIKKEFEETFKNLKAKVKKVRTSRQKPVLQKPYLLRKFPGKCYTKLKKKAFIELVSGQELPDSFYENPLESKPKRLN